LRLFATKEKSAHGDSLEALFVVGRAALFFETPDLYGLKTET
jgi:hypothetical protein